MIKKIKRYCSYICLPLLLLNGCVKQKAPTDNTALDIDKAMEIFGAPVQAPVKIDPNKVLATVDNSRILQKDLESEVVKLLQKMGNKLTPERLAQVRQQVLDQSMNSLINRTLIKNELAKAPVEPSPEKIESLVNNIKKSLPEGLSFNDFLERQGIDEPTLRSSIGDELAVAEFLAEKTKVTEEPKPAEIETFYKENNKKFDIKEAVNARHILLKATSEDSGEVFVSQKKKIKNIHAQLENGADFSELIKLHSEGGNAKKGGAFGAILKDGPFPNIQKVIFNLQPGEHTEPIKTKFGFHILQVLQKQEAKIISLEEATPQIKQFLIQQKQQNLMNDYLKSLKETATITIANQADE